MKKNISLLYLSFLMFTMQYSIAQVGIGTTTPDASSILDLTSTSKGMLLPRMTTAQRNAIGTPVSGLMIYNTTTSNFNYYNGSAWTSIFSGSSGVNSVTGTANRITIGGTSADPTIDISTSYAGQSSITTLGTIGTGTWNGTLIGTAYGGTGTSTTFTQGSVVFADASGNYTQNNSKLFWNNTSYRLGVGTSSPNSAIQVGGLTNGGTDNILIGGAASPGFMLNTLGSDFGTFYSQAANTVGIGFNSSVAVPSLAVFKVTKTGMATFGTSVSTDDKIILQPYGGGANSFEGTITSPDLTAGRTYILPDASGTFAVSASGNIALSTAGNISFSGALSVSNGGTGATTLSGILKGNGTSAITSATAGTDYSAGTSALGTGLLKSTTGTGALSIAVAGDFPILNQNTTGSAATLTTPRSIYGNLFDGSADLTQTIAPSFGGTGISSYTIGDLIYASGTTTLSKLPDVATGNALISGGVGVAPSWGKIGLTTHVSGILPVANGGSGTSTAFTTGSIVFAGASGVYTQDNSKLFWDDTNNRLGVGTASPTSQLHLAAGTAAASTAPLKFTSGTNLTTPENGAVEYDGTHIYITIAGTRYQLDQQNTLKATYQATPADPTSTSSTSGVMMGIAGSITPTISGKVMIVISGDLKNGTNNGNTTVQLRYGTGAAPTNGNALTGTAVGGQVNMTAAATNQRVPFSCNAIVTLTVGTTYWIDLALKAVSGSAFTQNLSVSVIEL